MDGIEDTGNLGAIMRSAAAVEIDGMLISIRNSAPVNETVWKTSAGTLGKVRLVQSRNLTMDIEKLKKAGFWVVATDQRAKMNFYDFDFKSKTAVIFGNESKGVSPLLKKNADQLLAIPHSPGRGIAECVGRGGHHLVRGVSPEDQVTCARNWIHRDA